MSSSFDRYQKRRLISSYFSVVISIALVLFLLGIVGFLLLNAKKVTDFMKENVNVTVYLKDTAKDVEIKQEKWSSNREAIDKMSEEAIKGLNKIKEEVEEKLNSFAI